MLKNQIKKKKGEFFVTSSFFGSNLMHRLMLYKVFGGAKFTRMNLINMNKYSNQFKRVRVR